MGPNSTTRHPFAVVFIDNLDPTITDQIAFENRKDANGDWVFDYWFRVGKATFRLTFVGPS